MYFKEPNTNGKWHICTDHRLPVGGKYIRSACGRVHGHSLGFIISGNRGDLEVCENCRKPKVPK